MIWIAFNLFVIMMLVIDLYFFHHDHHVVKFKEAITWTIVWIVLALLFCLGIYYFQGTEQALNFLAGYLIEKSLSLDNLFVFLMIFSYFATPKDQLHTVLFWGVLGALVMRAIFIFTGVVLLAKFHWIIYLFGAFLVYTGFKFLMEKEREIDPEKNIILKLFRRFFSVTNHYVNGYFFIKEAGKYIATPLFVVLVIIETTDVVFALDSVPAILAITDDPFIVYTSNVFAILGLRALYFALAGFMELLCYLNYGLAALLIFIGVKMLLSDVIHIPIHVTLAVIFITLTITLLASIFYKKEKHHV